MQAGREVAVVGRRPAPAAATATQRARGLVQGMPASGGEAPGGLHVFFGGGGMDICKPVCVCVWKGGGRRLRGPQATCNPVRAMVDWGWPLLARGLALC